MLIDKRVVGLCVLVAVVAMGVVLWMDRGPRRVYLRGDTMGTTYGVTVWSGGTIDEAALRGEIDALLEGFSGELSNWESDSWVSRFNRAGAGEATPMPEHAYRVVKLCLELAERSEGALDPTVSPLVEVWGFGVGDGEADPSDAAVREARSRVGYRNLVLDDAARTLTKTRAGVALNCSAVAKGYAVDRVAALLDREGFEGYLVNIGGEIVARGQRGDGTAWRVGITGQGKTREVVVLNDEAMATSGHDQRYREIDGERYSHVIDPRTGRPVAWRAQSLTVVAPNCALADGLATAGLVMEERAFAEMVEGYAGVRVIRTEP